MFCEVIRTLAFICWDAFCYSLCDCEQLIQDLKHYFHNGHLYLSHPSKVWQPNICLKKGYNSQIKLASSEKWPTKFTQIFVTPTQDLDNN